MHFRYVITCVGWAGGWLRPVPALLAAGSSHTELAVLLRSSRLGLGPSSARARLRVPALDERKYL